MVSSPLLVANMMVGEVEVKERPRPSPDYLMQLLNEKKLMTSLPNLCGIFTHLERLLDEGKRACAGDAGAKRNRGATGSGACTASLGDPARTTASYTPEAAVRRRHGVVSYLLFFFFLTETRTLVLARMSLFNLSSE